MSLCPETEAVASLREPATLVVRTQSMVIIKMIFSFLGDSISGLLDVLVVCLTNEEHVEMFGSAVLGRRRCLYCKWYVVITQKASVQLLL